MTVALARALELDRGGVVRRRRLVGRRCVAESDPVVRVALEQVDETEVEAEGAGGIRYGVDEPHTRVRKNFRRVHEIGRAARAQASGQTEQRELYDTSH